IRTTLRFLVSGVYAREAFVAGYSVAESAPGSLTSAVVSSTPTSWVLVSLIPVRTTLANGSLAKAVAPASSESKPKPNASSKSTREPKDEILAALAAEVPVHPRHRLTARVRKGGPKTAYKRAAKKSSVQAESGTL